MPKQVKFLFLIAISLYSLATSIAILGASDELKVRGREEYTASATECITTLEGVMSYPISSNLKIETLLKQRIQAFEKRLK